MRARPTRAAAFAVVVFVVGQLAAFAHATATRHVVCEEHGEQMDAPVLVTAVEAGEQSQVVGVEGQGGEHEDCAILRVLRPSTDPSQGAPVIASAAVIRAAPCLPPAIAPVASADLVLIAPKTSPPV